MSKTKQLIGSMCAFGFTASALVLAGCSTAPTITNTNEMVNGNSNTPTEVVNASDNTNENTNVAQGNKNVNIDVGDSNTNMANDTTVDTRDWQVLNSTELSLSFSYPKLDGNVEYFTSNCDDEECLSGKIIGWKYTGEEVLPRKYTLAAVVTDDFMADRDTWSTDYAYFEEKDGGFYLNGDKSIDVEQSGTVNGLDYIIYKLDSLSPLASDLPNAYVAMINFPEQRVGIYKALTIYFENPSSLSEVIKSIESVKIQ